MADDPDSKPPRRPRRASAPNTTDPLDIALEAELAGEAPPASVTAILHEHARLIRAQRRNENLGSALKVLTGVVGLVAAAAIGAMVWQASNERGLVIEAFSVPPDMAADGLTGQVLAAQLEDRLSALQARTDSARAAATYANDWGHDISVEIPQTGVSISELQRWLRQWLGHQTRVSGEIFRTPTGELRLAVRTGGQTGDTAVGSAADLDDLMQKGAEALFARTQPYRYGVYLAQNSQVEKARQVFSDLAQDGPAEERAWAVMGVGLLDPDMRRKRDLLNRALRLDPDNSLAWSNLVELEAVLGHPENALDAARRGLALLGERDRGGMGTATANASVPILRVTIATLVGDYAAAAEAVKPLYELPSYYGSREYAPIEHAILLARNHDPAAAEVILPAGQSDADLTRALAPWSVSSSARAEIAMSRGDWATALAEIAGMESEATAALTAGGLTPGVNDTPVVDARRVELLARLGRFSEAADRAGRLPPDCYECLVARGELAARMGRAVESDRWFARAAAAGPSLVIAEARWAEMLLLRKDAKAALEKARAAGRKGPRFADAAALEGEALLALGRPKEAARALARAAAFAPRWKRAHLLLADAYARSGNAARAAEQRRMAARLT